MKHFFFAFEFLCHFHELFFFTSHYLCHFLNFSLHHNKLSFMSCSCVLLCFQYIVEFPLFALFVFSFLICFFFENVAHKQLYIHVELHLALLSLLPYFFTLLLRYFGLAQVVFSQCW